MTAPLRLDLAQNSVVPYLRFTWVGLLLLLIGLVTLILTWRYHASLLVQQSDLEASIHKVALALDAKQPKRVQQAKAEIDPKAMKALQSANQAIEMPWTILLNTLEDAQLKHIALLEVQPDSKKQRVLIVGEAKNYASIIAYIELLERQTVLQDVYLQKHQVSEDVQGQPVQFTLGAVWRQSQAEQS